MVMDYLTQTICKRELLSLEDAHHNILVLKGEGFFHICGQSFPFKKNDMFMCTSNEALQIEPALDKPVILGIIRLWDYDPSAHIIHLCPAETTDLVRKVFFLAMDIQDSSVPNYKDIFTSINYLMFAAVASAGQAAKSAHPLVLNVISEILEHFSDPSYDVRVSIEKTGYSLNHFRKVFCKETGVSPTEFLTNKRIDRAIELFQKKKVLTIREVALECGFDDPYYFSRVFKKKTGESPQKYLESHIMDTSDQILNTGK